MKKNLLGIISIFVCAGFIAVQSLPDHTTKSVAVRAPKRGYIYAAEKPVIYTPPTQLLIPKIGLSAQVIPVGLDSKHNMDVPPNFVQVGWYDLGFKPGERGNAVLDGHYDDFHGNPAVFYNLDKLQVGDSITVTTEGGKTFTYVVKNKATYDLNAIPMAELVAPSDTANLNIITCHGEYVPSLGTYNQRTVIYSQLQG